MTIYAILITALAGFLLGLVYKKREKKPNVRLGNSKIIKKSDNEEYLNFLNYDGTHQG